MMTKNRDIKAKKTFCYTYLEKKREKNRTLDYLGEHSLKPQLIINQK